MAASISRSTVPAPASGVQTQSTLTALTMRPVAIAVVVVAALIMLAGVATASSQADPVSPSVFCVRFATNVNGSSVIAVNVTRAYAPLGADRLYALVQGDFFDSNGKEAAFFRVVPGFVVQFGISGDPAANAKWDNAIPDDPVVASNIAGTISFATAGPNTRTTQLFINYVDNSFLDQSGFAPLGVVTRGMDVAKMIFNPTPGDSNGVDQDQYTENGQAWIEQNYPNINSITGANVTTGSC
ncbi:cyclophilin-type peptidylprolyl cis-trans isomerase [Capsaspora owczarzaki ATCC 30864]|uniref:Peptidyl-prolyl cis-trans isomerase n=1 Tax=Capsaspora owczarzaki (strain ATCC 30864) TaxID=595528 RepID=A0A0D2VT90_CAPO3|nr:cyclophilin-type peptidylprolyl cis-trans isomerase [Capsaspora owczarzaki ATCC 30864]KJE94447.1 cyclophilin-type peptidylprolyl cis-trans isomerase [Capsaspora owczarzaki ATCC 30864]|eukprot:XP_004346771.1 cyclophilin-type peptidylprolyl cis-trans isomerase [Capsaspora owczarzaki ATCC 30864]